jgi:hypothetical protein
MTVESCRRCGQPATHEARCQRPDYVAAFVNGIAVKREGWIEEVPLCEDHAREAVAGPEPPRWLDRTAPVKRTNRKIPQDMIPGTEHL